MNLRKVHKYKVTHSRAEERKYVSNVLKVNGYTKTSSVTAENQLQLVALPMRGNQRLVLLLFPTFRVLRNPSKRILNRLNVKVAQRPLQSLGHIFAKPKDPVTKEQPTDAFYSIPCNDCDNEYIGRTKRQFGTRWKEHQIAVFFCKKENSALSEHTCLTNHTIGWDKSKIITTNRRYHRRLCLEAWHIKSCHAPLSCDDGSNFLTPIYTSSEKGAAN